jgi:hypothetical protein
MLELLSIWQQEKCFAKILSKEDLSVSVVGFSEF